MFSVGICAVGFSIAHNGFGFAMALTAWGLVRMDINQTYKVFLGVSWLYLITTAFTLAKMLRDRYDADLLEARLHGRREAQMQSMAAAEESIAK